MSTVIAILVLTALAALLVALLEHNARRTSGLPRAPFGSDAESDLDLGRVLHDLDAGRFVRRAS